MGLARLGAGSSWPQVALLLFLGGVAFYVVGLRLSPLRATLGQDLLGVRRPGRLPAEALPVSPPAPIGHFCPACGQSRAPDARFCKGCGRALT